MDHSPAELLIAVCELLSKEEIARLRLVSRRTCQIATPFLMSEVKLVFMPESFRRLVDISKHPIISRHITSILYEAGTIVGNDRSSSEGSTVSEGDSIAMPPLLPSTASVQEWYDFTRRVGKYSWKPYKSDELVDGWVHYQQFYQQQDQLIRWRYGEREIREAIARLPNLKEFHISVAAHLSLSRSSYLERVSRAGFPKVCDDCNAKHFPGVPQLQSWLLPMQDEGIKLQAFRCENISWEFFRCPEVFLQAFASTLAQVRELYLRIAVDEGEVYDGQEAEQCRRCLNNGILRDSITTASKTEALCIQFDFPNRNFGIDLHNVVGNYTWSSLDRVVLGGVKTTEDQLIGFLARHRATLRHFKISSMLLSHGEWPILLPKIRSVIPLSEFLLEGDLLSVNPHRLFEIGVET